MTTDEKRERSFDNVLSELRACHMHGAYLVMMAQATSARDLRAMHETLMPDDCRLLREDYLILETEWQNRHSGSSVGAWPPPFCDEIRRQFIEEARDHVVMVRRENRRGDATMVYHDPVLRRANMLEYYLRHLSKGRRCNEVHSHEERGNIRDPHGDFSHDDFLARAYGVGLTTDFIAILDKKCFEVGLQNASYESRIGACITIPVHTITEPMTHAILNRLKTFSFGKPFRWHEQDEEKDIIISFFIGDETLKALLPTGDSDTTTATPEFITAMQQCLQDTGITIAPRSSFKAAS